MRQRSNKRLTPLRQEGHRVMIALDETDEPEQTTHRLQVAEWGLVLRAFGRKLIFKLL